MNVDNDKTNTRARVALVKGGDRYHNVRQALALIGDDIDLAGKRRVLIKPHQRIDALVFGRNP